MATQLKIRRDTATDLASATPVEAEPGYDTTNKRLLVGDGSRTGGIPHASFNDVINNTFVSGTMGGTANALTLTLPEAPTAYADNQGFIIEPSSNNTGSATLNVNSLGAKTMRMVKSGTLSDLEADDLVAGTKYFCVYDGTYIQIIGGSSSETAGIYVQVFTTSGTFTTPANSDTNTRYKVTLIGGGQSGGGGAAGGTTSFGSYLSATGGSSLTGGSGSGTSLVLSLPGGNGTSVPYSTSPTFDATPGGSSAFGANSADRSSAPPANSGAGGTGSDSNNSINAQSGAGGGTAIGVVTGVAASTGIAVTIGAGGGSGVNAGAAGLCIVEYVL